MGHWEGEWLHRLNPRVSNLLLELQELWFCLVKGQTAADHAAHQVVHSVKMRKQETC